MRAGEDLPELVRKRLGSYGAAGETWLRDLPGLVEELEARWRVRVGRVLDGGTAGFVAEAVDDDGRDVVVKIEMAQLFDETDTFAQSVTALQVADGRGCVELLAVDRELGALLLERLGPNLTMFDLPVARQLEITCETLREVWRPVASGVMLPTGASKARWLAHEIEQMWNELGAVCARRTIDVAVEYAAERERAFDRSTAVLVHGDAHVFNTLQAGDDRFKFVDPEGLISEPAHDLSVPMREFHDELLAGDAARLGRARARFLAELTGVDAEAIWQWGFIERVSTGLYCGTLGFDDFRNYLVVADEWGASA